MQAVIMAGGKGTRLAELTRDEIPKPMVELAGKPLLLWQIERLKENGIHDILLVRVLVPALLRIISQENTFSHKLPCNFDIACAI